MDKMPVEWTKKDIPVLRFALMSVSNAAQDLLSEIQAIISELVAAERDQAEVLDPVLQARIQVLGAMIKTIADRFAVVGWHLKGE
jgi:hypothetical protein